jgi:hypothetical protein
MIATPRRTTVFPSSSTNLVPDTLSWDGCGISVGVNVEVGDGEFVGRGDDERVVVVLGPSSVPREGGIIPGILQDAIINESSKMKI